MKRRKSRPLAGSFSVVIQPRPSKRWADPNVPECDPNWVVRFSLPGRPVRVESSRLPVCERCLEDRGAKRVLVDSCGCRKPVLEWANAKLDVLAQLWHTGRLDELGQILNPKEAKCLKLSRVVELYGRCSLDAAVDNLASLKLFYEAPTGKLLAAGFVDELTANHTRKFAALYQEYVRRGWGKRGTAPADAWEQLRALNPTPAIDWKTPSSANTTIRSVLARVKSIFGPDAREKYIHEIAAELPDMREFRECNLSLPKPDNRDAMSQVQYRALMDALPALREMDARMWLLVRIAMVTGLRSVELLAIQRSWIEVDEKRTVLLVVKQRADFQLKDRESKVVREIPLPADVLQTIRSLEGKGSIYALDTKSAIDALYRRVNSWVRMGGFVAEDSDQVLYVVGRKTRATAHARTLGIQSAADALGHATSATTQANYIEPTLRVQTMSDEETAEALTTPRQPWA